KPQAGKQVPPIVVKLVEDPEIREIIKPRGRPLLINFWATWCDPCREEFPDLVEIDRQYKGKIDFITISLDDPEDIKTRVPQFL
ncbi:TlpA family protein disulfide reductase, partial [Escherichia coli]|nr:TlpA family protein disulfide reductase [Escherichia coli]